MILYSCLPLTRQADDQMTSLRPLEWSPLIQLIHKILDDLQRDRIHAAIVATRILPANKKTIAGIARSCTSTSYESPFNVTLCE
jgi:hypothetical protein